MLRRRSHKNDELVPLTDENDVELEAPLQELVLNLLGDRVKPYIRLCTDFLEGGRGHVWDEGRERNYEILSLRWNQIRTNTAVAELF